MDLRTLFKGLNMSINFDLLIAASNTVEILLFDKNATPLANGVITCYQDDSRTTLKNWYYRPQISLMRKVIIVFQNYPIL